ncbi:MAG: GGDEF domain-containing protein [Acidobacteria bacterium]|nr:MAG: GGDEF domain-containing protein [Acidobacteriota bacterium]
MKPIVSLSGYDPRDGARSDDVRREERRREAHLRLLTEKMPAIVWSTDSELRFTSCLGAGLEGLGLRPREQACASLFEFFATDDAEFLPISAHRRALMGEAVHFELEVSGRALAAHVEPLRDGGGAVAGTIGVALDITDQRRAEQRLLHVVRHDALTGLPNRAVLLERLQRGLQAARRGERQAALLLMDVDRFKAINTGLGNAAGDGLLCEIARRVGGCVTPRDTLARYGEDGFAVLIEGVEEVEDAVRVARWIQRDLAAPISVEGRQVVATASIGISLVISTHHRPEDVLRDADTALHRAKALGRARYEVFDEAMHVREVALLELEMELRQAVDRGEFRIHYQPILTLDDGRLVGFEGLARWQHPRRGLLHPAEFIGAAEESGVILELDHWMLREGCRQARAWRGAASELPAGVSVNLAGKGLAQRDLVERVAGTLKETGVEPNRVRLEVTEGVLMEDAEAAGATLGRLRALDLGIGIDDFGTGQSSLSHLHRLPVDTLKIDRSFVGELGRRESAEIVRTIVRLGHGLGLTVVAEGVETPAQLRALQAVGCEYGQGYLFSPPVEVDEAQRLLATGWRPPA